MAKPNFCKKMISYACTASGKYNKCKFYKEYAAGACEHLAVGTCSNERAWKDAEEKQRAAEYSGTKLTA